MAAFVMTGCTTHRYKTTITYAPDTHLIFNPEWTGIQNVDVPRSEWPITTAYYTSGEVVEFRETITDIQGRSGLGQDQMYRRFQSVRRGYRSR